jgi:hypothetical protein
MNKATQFDDTKASRLKSDVVCKAITALESMTGNLLLSGDDSMLRNTWEEVCVQVQGEESFYWDTYLNVIDDLLTGFVRELSQQDLLALWSMTEAGGFWLDDVESGEVDGNEPPVAIEEIIDYLKTDLVSKAADFENSSTRRYLAHQNGDYEEENEDEEEDGEEEDGEEEDGDDDELIEDNIAESSPVLSPKTLVPVDYEALWDKAMAVVRSNEFAAPGTSTVLDEVYAALDEHGKASLTAALEGLEKIFGSRNRSPVASEPEVAEPGSKQQPNLSRFDANTKSSGGTESE